ncbi:MAG: beta-lactamase family protein [Christensenellaceae bacterium]|jgi:hypothetical protein|nr:beta-lactamase family protein [Christensenellaceae bacterium]
MKNWNKKIQYAKVHICGQETEIFGIPDRLYQLASNSKAFTALGILLLVQQKRLKLDLPTDAYSDKLCFSDKHGLQQTVTIRQLLNHYGGLDKNTIRFQHEGEMDITDAAQAITKMPLKSAPGTKFCYATGGYIVLGRIIEIISGQSYGEFIRKNIFAPLDLDATDVEQVPLRGLKDGLFGVRYANWKGCGAFAPAGYLISSPKNCARWLELLLGNIEIENEYKILLQRSLDLRDYVQTKENGVFYGFGWYYDKRQDVYFHDGRNPYFSSCIAFSSAGKGAAALCNIHLSRSVEEVFEFMGLEKEKRLPHNFKAMIVRIGIALLFISCALVLHVVGVGVKAIVFSVFATTITQIAIYLISGELSIRQQYLWLPEWLFVLLWVFPAGIVILIMGVLNLFSIRGGL